MITINKNIRYEIILGYNSLMQLETRGIILEINGIEFNIDTMEDLDFMILKLGGEDAHKKFIEIERINKLKGI